MTAIDADTLAARFPELTSSLGAGELEALLEASELHDAAAGEALVAQGTHSSDLFLVLDGRLDIVMSGPDGERRLAGLEPGSYFGEVSLLDPGPAGASVVTEQGCVALRLGRAELDELRTAHPGAAAALIGEVLRSLSARLRAASERLGEG